RIEGMNILAAHFAPKLRPSRLSVPNLAQRILLAGLGWDFSSLSNVFAPSRRAGSTRSVNLFRFQPGSLYRACLDFASRRTDAGRCANRAVVPANFTSRPSRSVAYTASAPFSRAATRAVNGSASD